MTRRERWPVDAGPEAILAFLRFVGLVLFAALLVGIVRGGMLVREHHYLDQGLLRLALLTGAAEASRPLGWASVVALVVGLPALGYAVFAGKRFGIAATFLSIFPAHDLLRRATADDPEGFIGLFGPVARALPEESRYPLLLLAVSVVALVPIGAAMRRVIVARRPSAVTFVMLALAGSLLPTLVRFAASRGGSIGGANVVLITIDTLRADRLSAYGNPRPTSPFLDELAARGVLFEHALTPTPRTTQSVSTIMTALYPQTHGVRSLWDRLPRARLTLAEAFRNAGYLTAAFWTTTFLDEKRGLSQGFDEYENTAQESDRAVHVSDRAILWLSKRVGPRPDRGRRDRRRPFFLWLHYRDPHMPYDPPPEDRIWVDPTYVGQFTKATSFWPTKQIAVYNHLGLIGPADVAQATALYDGEIHYADRQIRRVSKALEERGLLEKTLIVVTSDHGEGLGEHGYYFDHGDVLLESSIEVPLILAGPELPVGRVQSQVGLIDVAPTIARLAGIAWPAGGDGRDLGPTIARAVDGSSASGGGGSANAAARDDARPLLFESGENLLGAANIFRFVAGVEGRLRAVRTERWKLILTPRPNGARAYELYDLDGDPAETLNVFDPESPISKSLEKTLQAFVSADRESTGADLEGIEPEDVEKMQRMGYLR